MHGESINDIIVNNHLESERLQKIAELNEALRLEQERSLFKGRTHLMPKFLLQKSDVCKHPLGCFENGIRRAGKTFGFSFALILGFKFLYLATKPSKMLKGLMKIGMYTDSAKFGLFSTVFSCAYKLILCLLRGLGSKSDKVNAPIAGFISAWSLAM